MTRMRIVVIIAAVLALIPSSGLIVLAHNGACSTAPPLATGLVPMRAMVYRCYGGPEVVKREQLERPQPAPDRVLVRVMATSVNPLDWHFMRGEPYFMRAMSGLGHPDDIRMGVDFAGTVEAVGSEVHRFKPGDRVFGGADGAFADYVVVRESGSIVQLPPTVSFEQGAATPIAAITALQALRDKAHVKAGQQVLINGASGGVGTFAVQIARLMGAHVTGVCSTRNVEMVRSIGAERVVDYTKQDFTRMPDHYDVIIDNVGTHSQSDYRRVLTDQGVVVSVGGVNCKVCAGMALSMLGARVMNALHTQQTVVLLAELEPHDLELLSGWMAQGRLKPVIDRRYSLEDLPAALAYLEQGHARGKVIIDIADHPMGKGSAALAHSDEQWAGQAPHP